MQNRHAISLSKPKASQSLGEEERCWADARVRKTVSAMASMALEYEEEKGSTRLHFVRMPHTVDKARTESTQSIKMSAPHTGVGKYRVRMSHG